LLLGGAGGIAGGMDRLVGLMLHIILQLAQLAGRVMGGLLDRIGGVMDGIGGGGNDVACASFSAITWSRADTPETARQVRVHNATGVALCGWGK
jgi:hypothetical protein